MVKPTPGGGQARQADVVEGARPRTGAAVAGLVLGAFVLVEAVLLGLGLLVTRVLSHSAWLHRDEVAFEQDVVVHRTPWWNHITQLRHAPRGRPRP